MAKNIYFEIPQRMNKITKRIIQIKHILEKKWSQTNQVRFVAFLKKNGIKIGDGCMFFQGIQTMSIDITRPSLIEIGNNVAFNKNFTLMTHDYATKVFLHKYYDFIPSSGTIKIGNNVSFGMNCTVLKGAHIGDNTFIGLGSIVTGKIPTDCVAMGSPAKFVCTIEEYYNKRKQECVEEAFAYARSIKERFNRMPVIDDFFEEFPLFLDGSDEEHKQHIKEKLGPAYAHFKNNHKATFNGLNDFLKHAGL